MPEPTTYKIIRTFPDIRFTVVVTVPTHDDGKCYYMGFVAHETIDVQDTGAVLWQRAGSTSSPNPSLDGLNDAEWRLRGDVKWDGCVNYDVNQSLGMVHACGISDFESEFRLWREIYRMAQSVMPGYMLDAEVAQYPPENFFDHVDMEGTLPSALGAPNGGQAALPAINP